MPPRVTPPTTEIGALRYSPPTSLLSWDYWLDQDEFVPELKWPRSVKAYDMMRTDSQLSGLYRAMTMPIRRFKFMIDPNGSPPEMVDGVARDLNLDVVGQEPAPRLRQKNRFSHNKHLSQALLALIYGHAFFEQVGYIGDDGLWHLKKLAPRLQKDVQEINVAPDGGLVSIRQIFSKNGMASWQGIEIPVDRLVAYVWDQEGASWVGRSLFRDCYKNWLIKDRLLRVDAINHQRAGGVPWAEAPPGATPAEIAQMSKMAQEFKVGEESGAAVPQGGRLNIARVGGGTDVVGSIRYHDDSMSRLFLHMFLQLGQTEFGSRALGDTFIEYAYLAQKAVAQWYVDTTNEHVIEDWVEWNYPADTGFTPLLTYVIEEDDEYLAVADLVSMIDAGAITVDDDLEDSLRDRFELPARGTPREPAQPDPTAPEPVQTSVRPRRVLPFVGRRR